jgi:hypothetical protein
LIEIPSSVEVIGSECFARCQVLKSISFEPKSQLTTIQSFTFSGLQLQLIMIPYTVEFIDGMTFCQLNVSDCLIESGNRRFVFRNGLLIDVLNRILVCNLSQSSHIEIPCDIEILGSACVEHCTSISFKSNSRFTQIESVAFSLKFLKGHVVHGRDNFRQFCSNQIHD